MFESPPLLAANACVGSLSRLCEVLSTAIVLVLRNSSGRVSMMPLIVSAGPTTMMSSAPQLVSLPVAGWAAAGGAGAGALAGNGGLLAHGFDGCFDSSDGGGGCGTAAALLCLGIGGASACGTSNSQVVTFSELRAVDDADGDDDVVVLIVEPVARMPQDEPPGAAEEAADDAVLARLCMLEAMCGCLNGACWPLLGAFVLLLPLLLVIDLRGGNGGAISSSSSSSWALLCCSGL